MKKDYTQKLIDKLNKLNSKVFSKESEWDYSTYNTGLNYLCYAIELYNDALNHKDEPTEPAKKLEKEIDLLGRITSAKNEVMDCVAMGYFVGHKNYIIGEDSLILEVVAKINELYKKVIKEYCGEKSINETIAGKRYELMQLEQEALKPDFEWLKKQVGICGSVDSIIIKIEGDDRAFLCHAYNSKKLLEKIKNNCKHEPKSQFLKDLKVKAIELNEAISKETEQKFASLKPQNKKAQEEIKPEMWVKAEDVLGYKDEDETENA